MREATLGAQKHCNLQTLHRKFNTCCNMPDPEKNHMREIMQVQKPCILQTWPLETLCATAWLFFIPMRDLRETTVGPLMDALDYIFVVSATKKHKIP